MNKKEINALSKALPAYCMLYPNKETPRYIRLQCKKLSKVEYISLASNTTAQALKLAKKASSEVQASIKMIEKEQALPVNVLFDNGKLKGLRLSYSKKRGYFVASYYPQGKYMGERTVRNIDDLERGMTSLFEKAVDALNIKLDRSLKIRFSKAKKLHAAQLTEQLKQLK